MQIGKVAASAIVAFLLVTALILAYFEPRPGADTGAEWRRLLDNSEPAFAFFLFPAVVVFVMPLINSKKFFSDPRSKDVVRFQFSDSNVSTESFIGKAEVNRLFFKEVVETPTTFFLFIPGKAQVIPKRCLSNIGEVQILRELFRKNIPKHKLLQAGSYAVSLLGSHAV